jgi:hypothetical protein
MSIPFAKSNIQALTFEKYRFLYNQSRLSYKALFFFDTHHCCCTTYLTQRPSRLPNLATNEQAHNHTYILAIHYI